MAAPQWTGTNSKAKSAQTAKALFRHNDAQRRAEVQHSNPHIDKSKTYLNFSYRGLTYEQRCAAYDARMGEIDQGKGGSGKNARTVLQSVILYPPAALAEDSAREKAWFLRAGELAEARFGKNLIDIAYDLDERHEYRDKDGKLQMSLDHGHMWLVPEVDGKLNGKQFSSRKNIIAFNAELQEMSIREFGCPMMDGSRAKGGKPVEQLKVESAAREIKTQATQEAQEILAAAKADAAAIRAEAEKGRQSVQEAARAFERGMEGLKYIGDMEAFMRRQKRKDGKTMLDVFQDERRKQGQMTGQEAGEAVRDAAAALEAERRRQELEKAQAAADRADDTRRRQGSKTLERG